MNRRVLSVLLGLAITVMLGMGTGKAETFRVITGEVGATGFKIKTNARMGVPVRGTIKMMPGTVEFDPESGKMGGQLLLDIMSFGPHYMHSEDSALAKLIVSGIERVCQGFHQLPDISMTMQGNPVAGFATADCAIIDVSLTLARLQS